MGMGHRPVHPITDRKVLEHVSSGIRKHQDHRNMHTGPGPLEIQPRPGLAPRSIGAGHAVLVQGRAFPVVRNHNTKSARPLRQQRLRGQGALSPLH